MDRDKMTSFRCLELLFFLLLLRQVNSEEPEPVFRAQGSTIEMGYCFGVDYIVVYRFSPEGDQVLGNSSASNTTITPPADLQDRIHISQHHHLLGLQIRNLTHMDSGIYRRECWQNQELVSQLKQQLSICDEEVESEEIIVKGEAEGTELLCNSTAAGLEGISVRWYHEKYPSYKLTLFLDSSVSLEPLLEEMQGVVKVKEGGMLLLLNSSVLKNSQHFHCLVIKGKNCLSFQNMYLPERTENKDIFASQGDRVVLNCPSDGNNQQWETPLGRINGSSMRISQMHIVVGDESEDFSLEIPAVTDEHVGEYSCISTSLELQYFLILCPKRNPQEKIGLEGGNFSLECTVGHDGSHKVQWYHRETSGEYELIYDTNDETVPVPKSLMDRLTLSDKGYSLTISDVNLKDAGVYLCVVLGGPEFLEYDDEYTYDYDGDETEDDGHQFMHDANRCIFKQETTLTLIRTLRGVTYQAENRIPETSPTDDHSAASHTTAYGLGIGLVGLLVVAVIAGVIAIKKKRATSRSGPNTNKDIKMNEDPSCTERLTNDECGA